MIMAIAKITNPNLDNETRNLDKEQYIKNLGRSVRKVGQVTPIVINEKNEVIRGRYLFEAMKNLGLEFIRCEVQ